MRRILPLIALTLVTVGRALGAAPPNDNFANAALLTGDSITLKTDNRLATRQTADIENAGDKTLWWTYRPDVTGRLTLTAAGTGSPGSGFSAALSIYLGTNHLSLYLVALDNQNGNGPAQISIPVTAHTDYQICVGSQIFNTSSTNIDLGLSLSRETNELIAAITVPASANNRFEDRSVLPGVTARAIGYNYDADLDPSESETVFRTIWWSWTASYSGKTDLDLTGSDSISKVVTVWRGDTVQSLQTVTNSGVSFAPKLSFTAKAGETYQIAVGNDSKFVTGGSVVLSIRGAFGEGAFSPEIDVARAIRLSWFGMSGRIYQIQVSFDSESWTDIGPLVIGHGNIEERFFTATNSAAIYRISAQ